MLLYLGAGASHYAGYRTFANFPTLIFDHDVRTKEGLADLEPNARRLLAAVKDSLERTDRWTTHDRFLWRLNEYKQFLELNQADPALQPFLEDIGPKLFDLHRCTTEAVNVMANTTVHHYSSNRVVAAREVEGTYGSMRCVYDLYGKLARLNGAPAYLPVFTTNYDMLMEDMFAEFGTGANAMSLVNGLPELDTEGVAWTPDVYESPPGESLALHLYRLHGCACWFYHHAGDQNVYFHRTEAGRQSIRNLCAMYPGLERERGAGPHGHGFRTFYDMLQACELIVFIGFSFRDDDVMHVLLKVLAERPRALKMLVIDSMYTGHNVQGRLMDAARRSTFPTFVPEAAQIGSLRLKFGMKQGFDTEIMQACEDLLRKGPRK